MVPSVQAILKQRRDVNRPFVLCAWRHAALAGSALSALMRESNRHLWELIVAVAVSLLFGCAIGEGQGEKAAIEFALAEVENCETYEGGNVTSCLRAAVDDARESLTS